MSWCHLFVATYPRKRRSCHPIQMVCDVRRRRPSARYRVLIAFVEHESDFGVALASGSNRSRAPSMLVRRLESAAKPPCHTITMNIYLISDCSHEYVHQMRSCCVGLSRAAEMKRAAAVRNHQWRTSAGDDRRNSELPDRTSELAYRIWVTPRPSRLRPTDSISLFRLGKSEPF